MTTPHGSRGGSVPTRPPAAKPQQWFVLRPWVFDVSLAGESGIIASDAPSGAYLTDAVPEPPGAAGLVLAGNVVPLDPEPAMLEG